MTKENSLLNSLRIVKHRLTEELWIKDNYFEAKGDKLCMCPHGGAQSVVNPKVRSLVVGGDSHVDRYLDPRVRATTATRAAHRRDRAHGLGATYRAAHDARAATNRLSSQDIWNSRPSWVKENTDYGNLEIHYLMGMVGLDVIFNDDKNTTFAMVQEKLDQAIALAQELNV